MARRALRRPLTAVFLLLVLAGCASRAPEPAPQPPSAGAAFPVQLTMPGGQQFRLDAEPQRIVSLTPSSTETLFAIGAGEQVVAVDEQSTYPQHAPRTELSGFTPNVEAIAQYTPDLVVASNDLGGLVDGLSSAGIPVLLLPAPTELDGTYTEIELLGRATGHTAAATALTGRMRSDIAKIVAQTPRPPRPLTYFHELDPTLYSANSNTFIGSVYTLFGLRNIADDAPDAAEGYPQLAAEAVLAADPDLIFLADTVCCGQTAQTVAARPGFAELTAVRRGGVVPLNDDVASRWGPRVVDLVSDVSDAVAAAAAPG
ncbi:MAG: helical backbone metal receptor [Pseudonocardiaceae bacterium]